MAFMAASFGASAETDFFDFSYESNDEHKNVKKKKKLKDGRLEIGVLKIKTQLNDKKDVSSFALESLYRNMLDVTRQVNAVSVNMLPHDFVIKFVSQKIRAKIDNCWYDHKCLVGHLQSAGVDLLVISKLRYVDTPAAIERASSKNNADNAENLSFSGEYTLFVKIVSMHDARVLREFVVASKNSDELPDLLRTKYRGVLKSMGLILADNKSSRDAIQKR